MNILNLFAGIGGNRIDWGINHKITAVEINQNRAQTYKELFNNDIVIIGDAYKYLEDHFREFDFIWASPPCQTHTRLLNVNISKGCKGMLPDLRMYGMIIFLNHFYKGFYAIENVKTYYIPLIKPTAEVGRHYIWANFPIKNKKFKSRFCIEGTKNIKTQEERNMTDPEIGKYILGSINNKNLEDFI